MTGNPIPGDHWVQIDLERKCEITRFDIDWESAFAKKYDVKVSEDSKNWNSVAFHGTSPSRETSSQHVKHEVK